MSAAAMANCAAGRSGVGPGVKRRTFFNMFLILRFPVGFALRETAFQLAHSSKILLEFIRTIDLKKPGEREGHEGMLILEIQNVFVLFVSFLARTK